MSRRQPALMLAGATLAGALQIPLVDWLRHRREPEEPSGAVAAEAVEPSLASR